MLRQIARYPAFLCFRRPLIELALIGLVLMGAATALSPSAQAQSRQGSAQANPPPAATNRYGDPVTPAAEPGKFDFYVLALSWSPSFCEASQERGGNRRPDQQCSGRPYAFVVHGLWPQHERGLSPANCQVPAPRVSRNLVDGMLGLMPSPRLVYHEWDRHGTCTGTNAAGYFDAIRKAHARITVPAAYHESGSIRTVSAAQVADAFVAANPGLAKNSLAVTCDEKRLTGVRICMNKDFSFRECADVARRSCQRDNLTMPAMRSSRAADVR
jgi:ribonuclease T2